MTEMFFSASITPSCGGAKAMAELEELSFTAAVAGRQERELVPSPRRKTG